MSVETTVTTNGVVSGDSMLAELKKLYANSVVTSEPTNDDTEQEDNEQDIISPLDLEPIKNLKLGWIDDYADLMTELTASPREFHQLSALVTAATVIQRKAFLPMAFGEIYPNIYGCVIAPSTVYAKSTAIAKPRKLLQMVLLDKVLIPSHGTSEGLVNQLSVTPNAFMIRDEIGTLFGSDKIKYLKDLKQDLTNLFDCGPFSKRLSNKEIRVDAPYLNILGATTPDRFYSNVSDIDWQDGLLVRWLFVTPTSEPDFDKMTGMMTEQEYSRLMQLGRTLTRIDGEKARPFVLEDDSYQIWADWRRDALKCAYQQGDESAMAIIGRYATYALKFAMILSAVNGEWGTITQNTMQTAMHLANNYKANAYRILTDARRHRVTGDKLQKVFLVIQKKGNPKGGMTIGEIMRYANIKQKELQPVLDQLNDMRVLLIDQSKRTPRYVTVADRLPLR